MALTLYIRPVNGLGNRLRFLSSTIILGKHLGYNVCVYWSESAGFDCSKWTDLFLPLDVTFVDADTFMKETIDLVDMATQWPIMTDTSPRQSLSPIRDWLDRPQSLVLSGSNNLKWVFQHQGIDITKLVPNFDYEQQQWYQRLRLAPQLLDRVNISTDQTIGIHIRRGDAILSPDQSHYLLSTDAAFKRMISEELLKAPEQKFYLATDDIKTKEHFQELYADRIITFDVDVLGNVGDKPGQDVAAIELYLLSRTRKIWGTNWSTFSDAAARWGNIELEIVKPKPYDEVTALTVTCIGTESNEELNYWRQRGYQCVAIGSVERPMRYSSKFNTYRHGVSIVTTCMNRLPQLLEALPTWLRAEGIDEIIIVDWSSTPPIAPSLPQDNRIRLIRVENESRWNLTAAYNTGFEFVRYAYTLKLDSDILLDPDFLSKHIQEENLFYAGDWKVATEENELHLNGQFYVPTAALVDVGGFHGYIKTYGYDDCDLYARLEKSGCHRELIRGIKHITGSDDDRIRNQLASIPFFETQKNRMIAERIEWTRWKDTSQYHIAEDIDSGILNVLITDRVTLTEEEKHKIEYRDIIKSAMQIYLNSYKKIPWKDLPKTIDGLLEQYGDELLPSHWTDEWYRQQALLPTHWTHLQLINHWFFW